MLLRGDCDGNLTFNALADGLTVLSFGFVPGTLPPPCLAQCDADGNRVFNALSDGLYILNSGFVAGSPPIPPPFPDCGVEGANSVIAIGCETPVCP